MYLNANTYTHILSLTHVYTVPLCTYKHIYALLCEQAIKSVQNKNFSSTSCIEIFLLKNSSNAKRVIFKVIYLNAVKCIHCNCTGT